MKKSCDKILEVIESDRFSLSKGASTMIEKDISRLLGEYFELSSLPILKITPAKGGYKITVEAECDRLKSFVKI